jgi:hypothetical protein
MNASGLRSSAALAPVVIVALAASAAAAVGWTRTAASSRPAAPTIRIVHIRPLRTSDPALRDLISHTFAIRVSIHGFRLLPYQPGVTADDNRPGAGHWRLYLDGQPLADNLGHEQTTYTSLPPGTHWLAAELSNADSTSLDPASGRNPSSSTSPAASVAGKPAGTAPPRPAPPPSPAVGAQAAAAPADDRGR